MTRKFFGTDGIRGTTNAEPMTSVTALRVGQAAGAHFLRGDHRHRVVIGKDTRLSGYMMESAMVAGFTSVGMDVVLLGPMPTPAVAMLTRSMRADLGVMISASHNPFADNGIKLFGPDGYKLSDEAEQAIERRMEKPPKLAKAEMIGRARRIDDARGRYVQFAKDTFPENLRLDGLKVVVDCANGAAYHVAPEALWELGAEVVPLGIAPNGLNINDDCGSTHPALMQETVVASGADIGLALDGDADRLIVADETGRLVDGDQLMALIALGLQARGELKGNAVVATVMSNLGLERKLDEAGLKLLRTKVGDRYVLEEMRKTGCNIGGEQSGHIILADHATTGDGLVAGLQVLAALVQAGAPASRLLRQFEPLPQLLKNVRFNGGAEPLESDGVRKRIAAAEAELEGHGRLVIRKSGTEPLIRVMAEGDDPELVERLVDDICEAVQAAA
ncbi:phosphoglucosamine mutase [Sphingomonas segetis]|jgi:phosphoglucosamine mutase|uniref:phosphoglucosamine mutase n=1 Tax=Sphingomonas segetis TaxID=1104779 RepID=UPI0012D33C82|nr:phosphoglucosamine mutase [Sphingomonas segetis]